MRTAHPEIESLRAATLRYLILPGQCAMETKKSWEIWELEPLRRIKILSKRKIFWITNHDEA